MNKDTWKNLSTRAKTGVMAVAMVAAAATGVSLYDYVSLDVLVAVPSPGAYIAYGQASDLSTYTDAVGIHIQVPWKNVLDDTDTLNTTGLAALDAEIAAANALGKKVVLQLHMRCNNSLDDAADYCSPDFLRVNGSAYNPLNDAQWNAGNLANCSNASDHIWNLNFLDADVMGQLEYTIEQLALRYDNETGANAAISGFELGFGSSGEPSPFIATTSWCGAWNDRELYGNLWGYRNGTEIATGPPTGYVYVYEASGPSGQPGDWVNGWTQATNWVEQYWTNKATSMTGNSSRFVRWQKIHTMREALTSEVGAGHTGLRSVYNSMTGLLMDNGVCAWYNTLRPDWNAFDDTYSEKEAAFDSLTVPLQSMRGLPVMSEFSNDQGETWYSGNVTYHVPIEPVTHYSLYHALDETADIVHVYKDNFTAAPAAIQQFNALAGTTAEDTPYTAIWFQHPMPATTPLSSCSHWFDLSHMAYSEFRRGGAWESLAQAESLYSHSAATSRNEYGTQSSWRDYYKRQTGVSFPRFAIDVDDEYVFGDNQTVDVQVFYKNSGTGTFKVVAENSSGSEVQCGVDITLTDTDAWVDATRTCTNVSMNNTLDGVVTNALYDIAIERITGDPILSEVRITNQGDVPPTPGTVPVVTGLTATVDTYADRIEIDWDNMGLQGDAQSYLYNLVRTTTTTGGDTPADNADFTLLINEGRGVYSFTDGSVVAGDDYYYWVRVDDSNLGQNGEWAAPVLGRRLLVTASTPTPTNTPTNTPTRTPTATSTATPSAATPTRIPPEACGYWYYSSNEEPPPYSQCAQGSAIVGYNLSVNVGHLDWGAWRETSDTRVPPGNTQYWYYCAPQGTVLEISGEGWSQNYEGSAPVTMSTTGDVLSGNITQGSYTDTCEGTPGESKYLLSNIFQGVLDLADTYFLNGWMANKAENACDMQPYVDQRYVVDVIECGWSQATPVATGTPVPSAPDVTVTPRLAWPPAGTPIPPDTPTPTATPPTVPGDVMWLDDGEHLFLWDDYYESTNTATGVANSPYKYPTNPFVYGTGNCAGLETANQPFTTVIKEGNLYRQWNNMLVDDAVEHFGDNTGYLTSSAPDQWGCPTQLNMVTTHYQTIENDSPLASYVSAQDIIVRPSYRTPTATVAPAGTPTATPVPWLITRVSTSNDGITWNQITSYDNGWDTIFPNDGHNSEDWYGDILSIYYDPWDEEYVLFYRDYGPYSWTNAESEANSNLTIRRVGRVTSTDLTAWSTPEVVFSPDSNDSGITQFYGGPIGIQTVGPDLQIGVMKILDDHTVAEYANDPCPTPTPGPGVGPGTGLDFVTDGCAYGTGYTVLTWKRPGDDWERSRTAWIDREDSAAGWDHAFAWGHSITAASDTVDYIYYGGYGNGHKVPDDRLMGYSGIGKNRYYAWKDGTITTNKLQFDADDLYLNVDTLAEGRSGSVTVSVRNEANDTELMSCTAVTNQDNVRYLVDCPNPWSDYDGTTIRLRFVLSQAYLVGFELQDTAAATPTPTVTATPGGPTPTATPVPDITSVDLNEVSLNSIDSNRNGILEPIKDQCIELFNPSTEDQSLFGWSLWDNDVEIYRFLSGNALGDQVLVVWGSQFDTILTGGRIDLKDANGSIVGSITPDYESDVLARLPNGTDNWTWLSGLSNSTCGFNNPNP